MLQQPLALKRADQRAAVPGVQGEQARNETEKASREAATTTQQQPGGGTCVCQTEKIRWESVQAALVPLRPIKDTRRGHSPPPKSHENNAFLAPAATAAELAVCTEHLAAAHGSTMGVLLGSAAADLLQASLPNRNQLGDRLQQLGHSRLYGWVEIGKHGLVSQSCARLVLWHSCDRLVLSAEKRIAGALPAALHCG